MEFIVILFFASSAATVVSHSPPSGALTAWLVEKTYTCGTRIPQSTNGA
jgi:hypothetical protein